jgi:hypothetical protein
MSFPPELTPTQMLAEIEAISGLKARYCRFLDRKQWPQFEELFTKDCTFVLDSADQNEMRETSRMKLDRGGFVQRHPVKRQDHLHARPSIRALPHSPARLDLTTGVAQRIDTSCYIILAFSSRIWSRHNYCAHHHSCSDQ